MADEFSYPWPGDTIGDGGPYSAERWWEAWQLLARGLRPDSSVLGGSHPTAGALALAVTANSPAAANVLVLPGAALVDGTLYKNDAIQTLSIAANASGSPRVDLIVLRRDDALQTIRLAVKQGTPAVSPAPPALTQTAGVMWEVALARVAVADAFTSIGNSDITPVAEPAGDAANVYLYDVLNNSGGELVTGDVVVWDAAANRAAKTTTTICDGDVAGVWYGATANGSYGRILVDGIGYVRAAAATTRGANLAASATAKNATPSPSRIFARALETTAGAGLVLCRVHATRLRALSPAIVADQKAANVAGGTFTSGAWQTRVLNTVLDDPDSIVSIGSNRFTLQPGMYEIEASAPAYQVDRHMLRLQDITAGTTVSEGQSNDVGAAQTMVYARLVKVVTIGAATTFEIQHRCSTTKTTDGFGRAANVGNTNEQYATVKIRPLA